MTDCMQCHELLRTWGLVMSNWSAPNADTLGLMPPVPRATTYRDPYKHKFWIQLALSPSCGGCKPGIQVLKAKVTMPCNQPKLMAQPRKAFPTQSTNVLALQVQELKAKATMP